MDKLTIDLVLQNSCGNPEDAEAFSDWQEEQHHRIDDRHDKTHFKPYSGWMAYTIELHCVFIDIVAKPLGDGTYEIREYSIR